MKWIVLVNKEYIIPAPPLSLASLIAQVIDIPILAKPHAPPPWSLVIRKISPISQQFVHILRGG